jgi:hypothetical protein
LGVGVAALGVDRGVVEPGVRMFGPPAGVVPGVAGLLAPGVGSDIFW